jgi:NDP-sugar pyrophosphorylase family protein
METITTIMIDVAKHHLDHIARYGVDSLVFCCAYNLRVAIRYIGDRCKHGYVGKSLLDGLGYLKALETVFNRRWKLDQ